MKKAHSILEMALILCVVVAVSFVVMKIFNDQKLKLINMSKSTLKSQNINLKNAKFGICLEEKNFYS